MTDTLPHTRWPSALALALALWAGPAHAQQVGFRASYESGGSTVNETFRMWTPPEAAALRGAVFLWAGAGQDWRDRAGWEDFQHAARALGFALVATRDNRVGETRAEVDVALDRIMDAAAAASGHPELADAPVALTGFSQGGFRTALATALSSGRVIGFVGHKGTQVVPLTAEGRAAPALMIAGEFDGSFTPDFVRQAFQSWRNDGGLAAYAVDWNVGHDDLGNQGWELAWYWLAEVVRLRYPESSPSVPASLVDLTLGEGWLGDKPRFRRDGTPFTVSAFYDVAPYDAFAGSRDAASWLPSRGAAYAYRAFTSSDLADRDEVPFQTPLVIRAPVAFDTLTVGVPAEIRIDARGFEQGRTIQRVALYDGADSLGTAVLGGSDTSGPVWTLTYLPRNAGITALIAVATGSDGARRTTFRTVVVRPVGGSTSSDPAPRPVGLTVSPPRPNPFRLSTDVEVVLALSSHVRVDVLDLVGRTVATLCDRTLEPGVQTVPFDASGLPGGTYLVRVTAGGTIRTQTVTLAR